MSQIPCKNPTASGRHKNNTMQNLNICPQVRGRSRNRQFRLMSTSDALETGNDVSPGPPGILNIVVPRHISSETSVISSRINVASLNVVSNSSMPSRTLDPNEFDDEPHFSELDSWMEQKHSTIKPSTKKCQPTEKLCHKEKSAETVRPMKSSQPCKPPQYDVNCLQQRLVKYRAEMNGCGDAAKLNGQLNEIFVQRLVDIENVAKDDTDIKLVTYQEWVDMLMQINEVIIGNMVDLESEVAERLECMKSRIKSTCSEGSSIEQKYRQDICSLMKLIKNAYHHDNWDIQGLEFHTVNLNEILSAKNATCSDPERANNLRDPFDDDQDSCNRCCVNDPEYELENVTFEPSDVRCGHTSRTTNMTGNVGSYVDACDQKCVEDITCKASCNTITAKEPTCSITEILQDYSFDPRSKKSIIQEENTNTNLRALAVEVAAKHDEICDLKRQISCLEEEIQKAQQKIQLKDNVIKELRNDLKCANTKLTQNASNICVACGGESTFYSMPPINLEQQSSRSASTQVSAGPDSSNQFPCLTEDYSYDYLSNAGQLEQQKLKDLDAELNELFRVTNDFKNQNLEYHRKRLSDIFQKSEAEKAEAYRKLDFIRKQLVNLDVSSGQPSKHSTNDSDSGFSSKVDGNQDAKILNGLRDHLRRLNDTICDLKNCIQNLKIENNELSTCLETERDFAQRNSDTLKDIADMLSGMSGEHFSYNDIYDRNSELNPFCQAIIRMKCNSENKERTLRKRLSMKCEQLELQKSEMCNENELKQLHSSTKLVSVAVKF